MATYTSDFSSWSGFEALLTATQAYESSPAFAAIGSGLVELENTLFYAAPNFSVPPTNTSITASYYHYPNYITAHIFGTDFLGSNPVVTRADITDGIYTLTMAGSISVAGGSPAGTITSIGFTGLGYAQHAVGRMPLDGSPVVFSSWSSTIPINPGSVSFAFTGTDTIDSFGNETITYSTISITDDSGHTASISGLNRTVSDYSSAPFDYVALLHSVLGGNDIANGGAGSNELHTFAGNDTLDGRAGADTMVGGDGNDTYLVDDVGDVVAEDPDQGADLVKSIISHALAGNVENLTLTGTANIGGTGNSLVNIITGNSGNNTLDGAAGVDTLAGGSGNDIYHVDLTDTGTLQDTLTEAANAGIDTVRLHGSAELATATTLTLAATLEDLDAGDTGTTKLNLTGNASANILTGNAGDNILTGNAGADTLVGGAGADTLVGGLGNDTYVVDNAGDAITENDAEGTDSVQSSITCILAAQLEKLTLTGSTAIDGTGNSLANTITGNSGNNTLNGAAGIDTLIGGAGNDVFVVDSLTDMVTELADGGSDWVLVDTALTSGSFVMAANVEYGILGSTNSLNLSGNAANNGMVGNNGANVLDGGAGNDTLDGGSGNDTLMGGAGNDMLNGQQGSDRMEGGAGNDIYTINRGDGAGTAITANEDTVVELSAAGTDTVISAVYTYTLDANVENLVLQSGNLARKGFGNAGDNLITGNGLNNLMNGEAGNDTLGGGAGNDTLSGGIGNDRLDGALGKDVLSGGAGNDSFMFSTLPNATTNIDRITDFSAGSDVIVLSNSVFTALGAAGGLNADCFYAGTGAHDTSDRIIFNTSNGALYYDSDGVGGTDQVQFATIAASSALASTDFVVGA